MHIITFFFIELSVWTNDDNHNVSYIVLMIDWRFWILWIELKHPGTFSYFWIDTINDYPITGSMPMWVSDNWIANMMTWDKWHSNDVCIISNHGEINFLKKPWFQPKNLRTRPFKRKSIWKECFGNISCQKKCLW